MPADLTPPAAGTDQARTDDLRRLRPPLADLPCDHGTCEDLICWCPCHDGMAVPDVR